MRVHTDAARGDNVIGLGWQIESRSRSDSGNRYIIGDFTSMEAEYFALVEGVREAAHSDTNDVMVFTDCEPLVQKMTGESDGVWHDRQHGFNRLFDRFEFADLHWVPRARNEDANTQAGLALRHGRESL